MTGCIQPVYTDSNLTANTTTIVGNFTFLIPVPDAPASVPAYRGIVDENEQIDYNIGDGVFKPRENVISKAEAWNATLNAMEKYGGLPSDAILTGSGYMYEPKYNTSTHTIQNKTALISLSFTRKIDGKPIEGLSDIIRIYFGETAEPLFISKRWHTIEPAGTNFSVISVRKALKKLEQFDTMNHVISSFEPSGISDYYPNATIKKMALGYWIPSEKDPDHLFQPVWIIEGNWAIGRPFNYDVYARQFAEFTATPVVGNPPLTITFKDTSLDQTRSWYWEFGDGTTSEEQNPVHIYNQSGTYTVTFEGRNEYGYDDKTIENCVTVYPQPSALSIFDRLISFFQGYRLSE